MRKTMTLLRPRARLAVILTFAALVLFPQSSSAQSAVDPGLKAAASFAVLGGSTVTNTGATIITGNLGVSLGTAITGFLLTNTIQNVPPGTVTAGPGIVNGTIYAGPSPALDAFNAHADAATAYGFLAGEHCDVTYGAVQEIGGLTLAPGVYCFPSSALVSGKLTLDAQGNPNAVWDFIIGSTLTTAVNSSVVVINGGVDTNVFWAIGSSATIGVGTAFTGNILAVASITLTAGATVSGRALAINGAVTMDTNTVASTCPSGDCTHPLPPPPRPPDVTQLLLDHYQCYQATPDDRVKKQVVVLEDQFGKSTVTLADPLMICTPTIKNVGKFPDDLRNPFDHLVCYDISKVSGNGKDGKDGDCNNNDKNNGNNKGDLDVLVNNQFGKQQLDVGKPQMLCVPSLKTVLADDHKDDHKK